MKRRTFLQLSAMSAAAAALGGCQSRNEKLIPFLIPPDEGVTPGLADYYASSCRSCPAGCGILVRVSEGRARKIEGNPLHPVNRGRLCARGQAALQELYHPDRIPQPLKRSGARGSGAFSRISWAEALDLLVAKLKEMQRQKRSERLALVTPQLRGTLAQLTGSFMRSFGSPNHLSFELLNADWLRAAGMESYGEPSLPFYDLGETCYLLSFGADFLEYHLSPVQYGNAFGRMRQGRDTVRGHFTYVGGRMSLTAASADRWMPARLGSEGALALGMARVILSESLFDPGALADNRLRPQGLKDLLAPYDLPRVAQQTGLAPSEIVEVAREFARTRPAIAMAGENLAFQSNGQQSVRAVQLLNLLVGNLNRPGGIYPDGGSAEGPTDSFARLLQLTEQMRGNRIELALIYGDPVHAVPPATGFQEALTHVPFIVSFSSVLDDSALQADLVLPDHSALESWGDVIPQAGSRTAVLGLMQPVVRPLLDTRPFAETLLTVAGEMGGATAAALPYPSYLDLLQDAVRRRLPAKSGADFATVWAGLLQQGGILDMKEERPPYRTPAGPSLPALKEARFAGDEDTFPLHLLIYPSSAFYDGRGAGLPWLQQFPDPMSTVVWDSWVEINPTCAAKLGIGQGDLVEVSSPQGSLRLPVVIYPAIRPDTVAIPLGQGHRGMGRYARGRGVNPLCLVTPFIGGEKPQPAWHATRVRVRRVSAQGDLVTAGHPEGSYRSELIEI